MRKIWRDRQFLFALLVPPLLMLAFRLYSVGSTAPYAGSLHQPGRWVALVLLWPVVEEVIFRGALQPMLTGQPWGGLRWGGLTAGNGLASLLFAAAHLLSHPPLWAALVFFPSLVFGYFRDRHDSLLSPILLHVVYNLGYYFFF